LFQDKGIDIVEADLARVLDLFVQVSNPSIRNAKETGLGLTLTKAFFEMHHGALSIGSEPSAFTKVSIILPKKRHIL
jgi:signal transduction histidine kinase